MNQQRVRFLTVMRERPVAQPVDDLVEVRGFECALQRLKAPRVLDDPFRQREQVQVVIAEYRYAGVAQALYEAQRLQRLRTSSTAARSL